jgi:hypothetical protein
MSSHQRLGTIWPSPAILPSLDRVLDVETQEQEYRRGHEPREPKRQHNRAEPLSAPQVTRAQPPPRNSHSDRSNIRKNDPNQQVLGANDRDDSHACTVLVASWLRTGSTTRQRPLQPRVPDERNVFGCVRLAWRRRVQADDHLRVRGRRLRRHFTSREPLNMLTSKAEVVRPVFALPVRANDVALASDSGMAPVLATLHPLGLVCARRATSDRARWFVRSQRSRIGSRSGPPVTARTNAAVTTGAATSNAARASLARLLVIGLEIGNASESLEDAIRARRSRPRGSRRCPRPQRRRSLRRDAR